MASGRFMEEMMREHEQALLEATLYDHIDDLLDFPKEEDCAADVLLLDAPAPGSPLSARIIGAPPPVPPPVELPPPPPPAAAAAPFFAAEAFGAKDCHIGPCEELDMDMAQLEWLSGLFDDASIPHEPAFNCAAPIKASAMGATNAAAAVVIPDKLEDALFRSSSPTSVLEDNSFNNVGGGAKNKNSINNGGGGGSSASSSSSSSASSCSESFSGNGAGRATWSAPVSPRPEPPVLIIPARARSKRSRQSAFVRSNAPAMEPTILVPTPMYSSTSAHSDPESCNIAETNSQPPAMKKKKKAKKPAPPVTSDAEGDADADYEEGGGGSALPPGTVRRCTHCQIEKTPQWRAGPLGPKTLCNACGVRYKSGRLFPEYRPAASPTFVPAIHSNSHKKVVEMRQKVAPKGDDLLQYIRRRD